MKHGSPQRKSYKLNELGLVTRGRSRHRPRNEPSLYGGSYPFFQTGDIKAADLVLHRYQQTYNEKGLAQSKIWEPGTLCITIAANIAETAILGIRGCFPDSIVGFIPDKDLADVKFIKYYIDTIKLRMQNASRGTTQDNLSLDKLLTFEFLVPDLSTQVKIASIIGAYDDLIANNTRRIEILDELTRLTYREWFAKFCFPASMKIPKRKGASLPEGWEKGSVGKIASYINRGVSPKYSDDESQLVINQRCIRDGALTLEFARSHSTTVSIEKLIMPGDVLVNSTGVGTLGRVAQVCNSIPSCTVDSHVTIVRPSLEIDPYFFGMALLELESEIELLGTGTTGQTELSRSAVAALPIVVPPLEVQRQFGDFVKPMRKLSVNLAAANRSLRETRNMLIVKLLSGDHLLSQNTSQPKSRDKVLA